MTQPLVAFLEARIAEEQAEAAKAMPTGKESEREYEWVWDVLGSDRYSNDHQDAVVQRWWPGRVLAEVAAKRAAIEHFLSMDWSCEPSGEHLYAAQFLVIMASVYKDHPDHQEDWGILD